MPKENRSSNTEMVSVPRHWAQETVNAGAGECVSRSDIALLSEALSQPAQQHQGEPVVLPARKAHKKGNSPMQNAKNSAWNACLDDIAKLGPLYTHADPCEVERLRLERRRMDQALSACANERDTLRTQLVEALAFLDEAYKHDIGTQFKREIKAFYLSASAEPSALPDPLGCNECTHAECGKFDGPRQLECSAKADNACARPGASS